MVPSLHQYLGAQGGSLEQLDSLEDSLDEVSSGEMEEYNRISDNDIWDQVDYYTTIIQCKPTVQCRVHAAYNKETGG